jgi:hypothetical protein
MDRSAPQCPECGRPTLKPVQAAALWQLHHLRGLFASMRVGSGKTLCTLLGPVVLNAQRPGLVVKGDLRGKTLDDIADYSKWWRVHPAFQAVVTMKRSQRKYQRAILSYEELQVKGGGVRLAQAAWDAMMLDEFQLIKDRGSARHKKIKRAWKHFKPATAVFSGSVSTRGFGDFWAPLRWALGAAAPLPLDLRSFLSWCYALDEKVPDAARLHPGPLVHLTPPELLEPKIRDAALRLQSGASQPGDANSWEIAQEAFGKRFVQCPGVISTKDDVPPFGLEIEVVKLEAPPAVREAVDYLRRNWATPDGNEFEHPFELWARERWLAKGGWFAWSPNPPEEWLAARKATSAYVRVALREHSRTLDSRAMVEDAIRAGKLDDKGVLAWWESVKPQFDEDNREWRWLPAGSYTAIEDAAAWLRERPRHAICWVVHEPVGEAVRALTGLPYFAGGSRDSITGQHIMECRTSCIASIRSCGTGKNLQHEFYMNNLLEFPTTGLDMEQLIGRTHRDHSAFETIQVRIPVMTQGDARGLEQVRADAARIQRTEQLPQKFCYGTWYGFDLARRHELL